MLSLHVSRDYFTFSAAHFAAMDGKRCEPLHGHNYEVQVAVRGERAADGCIVDFRVLKEAIRRVCGRLNHRVLIASRSPHVRIRRGERAITVRIGSKKYLFPISDTRLLPILDTTVECISEYLAQRLAREIREAAREVSSLEVTVYESPRQGATAKVAIS